MRQSGAVQLPTACSEAMKRMKSFQSLLRRAGSKSRLDDADDEASTLTRW